MSGALNLSPRFPLALELGAGGFGLGRDAGVLQIRAADASGESVEPRRENTGLSSRPKPYVERHARDQDRAHELERALRPTGALSGWASLHDDLDTVGVAEGDPARTAALSTLSCGSSLDHRRSP